MNGVNYNFYFVDSSNNDQYLAQVYVSLQQNVQINKVYKNS